MSLVPQYTISDIRLSVGDHEYNKGLDLYQKGKVCNVQEDIDGWTATVSGTHEYSVQLDVRSWDRGSCDCYLGERDELCKHMIALAIAVTKASGKGEDDYSNHELDTAYCTGEVRDISDTEYDDIKMQIGEGMKLIRAYTGPSSGWFHYQGNIQRGSRMILLACSDLPICTRSIDLCIASLKKLDKKLCEGGVDDSNGTVGGIMEQMVEILCLMSDIHPPIVSYILKKLPEGQTWDWDRSYRDMYEKLK